MGHRWDNSPQMFVSPKFGEMGTLYPVNIIEEFDDGSVLGTIDEDNLMAVKHVLLATENIRI